MIKAIIITAAVITGISEGKKFFRKQAEKLGRD